MPATEVINVVSPWMGWIVWMGEPRTGKSKKGNEWKSMDFTLKYADAQGQEQNITFSLFGAEKVDKVQSAGIGARVKVMWRPESHEYMGRWYARLEAFDIDVYEEIKETPAKSTTMPDSAPSYTPQQTPTGAPGPDLPFSKSPGVRG